MSHVGETGRKALEFITFGDVFIDLVMSGFARWPAPGEEVDAQSLTREIGGGAAITACGLARLGRSVALLAATGSDGWWFRDRLGATGVSLELLQESADEPTAITVAISTADDRSFFTYRGSNCLLESMITDPALIGSLASASHVHLANAVTPDRLIELARQLRPTGTTLSVDVGWVEDWLRDPLSLVALREIDLFLPNEREGAAMTGESDPRRMLEFFSQAGLKRVALKLGAAGSMMIEDGVIVKSPGLAVQVVDTTGAGDCFDAGFLAAWKAGLPALTCLETANICGARSTTAPGGLKGFPRLSDLNHLLPALRLNQGR